MIAMLNNVCYAAVVQCLHPCIARTCNELSATLSEFDLLTAHDVLMAYDTYKTLQNVKDCD
jgi:hypothetical protein